MRTGISWIIQTSEVAGDAMDIWFVFLLITDES